MLHHLGQACMHMHAWVSEWYANLIAKRPTWTPVSLARWPQWFHAWLVQVISLNGCIHIMHVHWLSFSLQKQVGCFRQLENQRTGNRMGTGICTEKAAPAETTRDSRLSLQIEPGISLALACKTITRDDYRNSRYSLALFTSRTTEKNLEKSTEQNPQLEP